MARLTSQDINSRLQKLTLWQLDGNKITRKFNLANFLQAMDFVNELADLAQELDHHPDILIHSWNKVNVTFSTHSEGGLTEKDFKAAEATDDLFDGL